MSIQDNLGAFNPGQINPAAGQNAGAIPGYFGGSLPANPAKRIFRLDDGSVFYGNITGPRQHKIQNGPSIKIPSGFALVRFQNGSYGVAAICVSYVLGRLNEGYSAQLVPGPNKAYGWPIAIFQILKAESAGGAYAPLFFSELTTDCLGQYNKLFERGVVNVDIFTGGSVSGVPAEESADGTVGAFNPGQISPAAGQNAGAIPGYFSGSLPANPAKQIFRLADGSVFYGNITGPRQHKIQNGPSIKIPSGFALVRFRNGSYGVAAICAAYVLGNLNEGYSAQLVPGPNKFYGWPIALLQIEQTSSAAGAYLSVGVFSGELTPDCTRQINNLYKHGVVKATLFEAGSVSGVPAEESADGTVGEWFDFGGGEGTDAGGDGSDGGGIEWPQLPDWVPGQGGDEGGESGGDGSTDDYDAARNAASAAAAQSGFTIYPPDCPPGMVPELAEQYYELFGYRIDFYTGGCIADPSAQPAGGCPDYVVTDANGGPYMFVPMQDNGQGQCFATYQPVCPDGSTPASTGTFSGQCMNAKVPLTPKEPCPKGFTKGKDANGVEICIDKSIDAAGNKKPGGGSGTPSGGKTTPGGGKTPGSPDGIARRPVDEGMSTWTYVAIGAAVVALGGGGYYIYKKRQAKKAGKKLSRSPGSIPPLPKEQRPHEILP